MKLLPHSFRTRAATGALLIIGLFTAGCAASRTWHKVADTPLEGRWQPGGSLKYARELKKLLDEDRVENKLVVYKRRGTTAADFGHKFDHAAIIYRDPDSKIFPWWFADSAASTPRWLPNGSVDEQLEFTDPGFVRVTSVNSAAPTPSDGKSTRVTLDNSEHVFRRKHGGKFNAASATDQQKMREIKRWSWTRTAVL